MRGYGVEAVVIVPTPELYRDSEELGAIAAKAGLPTIGGFRESAQKGFLIGYGPNLWRTRPAGSKLCGANVQWRASGRVTVSRSTHFDFAINMKTAKALGLTIPPSLLVGADEVIE